MPSHRRKKNTEASGDGSKHTSSNAGQKSGESAADTTRGKRRSAKAAKDNEKEKYVLKKKYNNNFRQNNLYPVFGLADSRWQSKLSTATALWGSVLACLYNGRCC